MMPLRIDKKVYFYKLFVPNLEMKTINLGNDI